MKKIIFGSLTACLLALSLTGCQEAETNVPISEPVEPESESREVVTDEVNSTSTSMPGSGSTSTSTDISGSISGSMSTSQSEMMTEDMYEVEIDNQTGSDIYGLQYSVTGSDEWGDEYSTDPITNGKSTQITVPKGDEGEMFDLRAYDNQEMSGDGWIFPEIDFTNDGRIILRYKDNAPDYEYG